jgi:DNA-directed RNA polymerase specialized sigma24 family protein
MVGHDKVAEWILGVDPSTNSVAGDLIEAATRMWPRALAHANRASTGQSETADSPALAAEVWEHVLRSVWKAQQRAIQRNAPIRNLDHYLLVAFIHRLNRHFRRNRRRAEVVQFVSPEQLAYLESGTQEGRVDWAARIEDRIDFEAVVAAMDGVSRKICLARLYGLSWQEIGRRLDLTEQQAIMRFQYAQKKIRRTFGRKNEPPIGGAN